MEKIIKTVTSDKIIRLDLIISVSLFFLTLLFMVIQYRRLPPFLPIFNQMPWGDERLGTRIEIFVPMLLTASVIVGNTFLAYYLYEKMPLVSRMLSIASLIIALITAIFIVRVALLVL